MTKNLAIRVAEELDVLAKRDPRMHDLIRRYITNLRAENARYRAQARDRALELKRVHEEA